MSEVRKKSPSDEVHEAVRLSWEVRHRLFYLNKGENAHDVQYVENNSKFRKQ
jgi:hypothetical protein